MRRIILLACFAFLAVLSGTIGAGVTLFQDDFDDEDDEGWSVIEGRWTVTDGVYVAPDPGGWNRVAKSIAGEDWWSDYTYEGRFKLGQGAHEATLMFRVQEANPGVNNGRFYQIVNVPTDSPVPGEKYISVTLHKIYGGYTTFKNVVYPVNPYEWHDFKIVLSGSSMKYYIDGNLVMTYEGLTSYSTGKIGLKTGHYGQAYFDDVLVYVGIPTITATIDIDPDTLNLNSGGKWITAYIELSEGYDVEDINCSTIELEGEIGAGSCDRPVESLVGDYDDDGIPDYMVKFDRSDVQDLLEPADEVELTITGEVAGTPFKGTDTIRIIDLGKK